MAKLKRPLDEEFHRAVTNVLGSRSPHILARENLLPINAISRVFAGVDSQLSRVIEIANALGFEVRYEWPRGADAHRQATRLAVHMMLAMRPEFRELTDHPQIWAFAEALIATHENLARELGPSRTGDPDQTFAALLRVIEMQKKMRPATDD